METEYNKAYYQKNRDKLLQRAKDRKASLRENSPVPLRPKGRPPGMTFPNGYKKKPVTFRGKDADEYCGAIRSPPDSSDVIYEESIGTTDETKSGLPVDCNK